MLLTPLSKYLETREQKRGAKGGGLLVSVKQNNKQFMKALTNFEKKQIPFATANAINSTLKKMLPATKLLTRKYIDRPMPKTEKGYFTRRASWKVGGKFKGESNYLTGRLEIKDFVASYLKWTIDGGVRSAKGKNVVPIDNSPLLNKYGNIRGRKAGFTGGRMFWKEVDGQTLIFKQVGGRKQRRVQLVATANKTSATYKKTYPFYEVQKKFVDKHFMKQLKYQFRKAMKTAK